MRAFISIDLPKEVRRVVGEIQKKLPEFKGKFTELENLHLTLKFLGEIDEEKVEKVRKRLGGVGVGGFEAEIDDIGIFSEKFVRIVWVHLSGCDELQEEIDRFLNGLFDKEKRFMSHVTIARVKGVKDRKEFIDAVGKVKVDKIKFDVDRFYLKESVLKPEGPEYKVVGEYLLGEKK